MKAAARLFCTACNVPVNFKAKTSCDKHLRVFCINRSLEHLKVEKESQILEVVSALFALKVKNNHVTDWNFPTSRLSQS